jgi:SAM-dependent methyltransferase
VGTPEDGSDVWLPGWRGDAYAANTGHHRRYDADFLADTPLAPADRVLDLGCGSGDFTAAVAALVPEGEVVGVDAQASMLDAARRAALANQSFVLGPLQRLGELFPAPEHDGSFDLTLSRAVLHWVPAADQPAVYAGAARLTRPGGWVRVECGGAGNVARLAGVLDEISARYDGPATPWAFGDPGAAFAMAEAAGRAPQARGQGFVRTYAQRRRFDRAGLTGWLQSQCLQAYTETMAPDAAEPFVAEVLAHLDDLRHPDGSFDQIYVRLDVLAAKPAA